MATHTGVKDDVRDVYLMAGDVYFGTNAEVVRTLLGSCIAAIIWHPTLHFTGMFHIVLPDAPLIHDAEKSLRYADQAIEALTKRVYAVGTSPTDYRVYVCGGGDMFNVGEEPHNIGLRNAAAVTQYLQKHKFKIAKADTGGGYYRHVKIRPATGVVQCEKHQVVEPHLRGK